MLYKHFPNSWWPFHILPIWLLSFKIFLSAIIKLILGDSKYSDFPRTPPLHLFSSTKFLECIPYTFRSSCWGVNTVLLSEVIHGLFLSFCSWILHLILCSQWTDQAGPFYLNCSSPVFYSFIFCWLWPCVFFNNLLQIAWTLFPRQWDFLLGLYLNLCLVLGHVDRCLHGTLVFMFLGECGCAFISVPS